MVEFNYKISKLQLTTAVKMTGSKINHFINLINYCFQFNIVTLKNEVSPCKEQCQVHAGEKDHARSGFWMDNINTWTGLSTEESIRMTEDRDKWRKCVHGVANPLIKDG